MNTPCLIPSRRAFLGTSMAMGASFWTVPGLFAEELVKTPKQTEGPFYPDKLPLDTDNDLLIVNDKITPAVGEISHVSGRILDASGKPLSVYVVEIWQCDSGGAYLHSKTSNAAKKDANFQGFGRFTTGSTGEYYFRTIKPVPYPGRTPHIHFKIKKAGKEVLTTQMYVKGHPGNEKDGIWKGVKDEKQREAITPEFVNIPKSKLNELAAKLDVVLGVTPELD